MDLSFFSFRSPLFWLSLAGIFFVTLLSCLLLHISPYLSLVTAVSFFFFILLLTSPLFALAGLIIVRMSLDYSSQYFTFSLFHFSVTLSQLLGVAISLLGFIFLFRERRDIRSFPFTLPFLIFFFWAAATLFYSFVPQETIYELLRFFDFFVISFLAYRSVKSVKDLQFLLIAIFASGVLPLLFGLYQIITGTGLADENVSAPRIYGTFAHPNVFSMYLFGLMALASAYLLAFPAKRRSDQSLLLLFLFSVSGMIFFTFARIAWIIFFFFLLLIALWRYRLALVPLIAFPIMLFIISTSIQERALQSFHPTPDSSIVWRQELWHDSIRLTRLDHQEWFGSGFNTFRPYVEQLRGLRFGGLDDAHNDFVRFYVEGGRVGLMIYLFYIGWLLFAIVWMLRQKNILPSVRIMTTIFFFFFINIIIASLSENIFKNTPIQWLFFTVFGALLSLSQQKKLPSEASLK